MGKRMLNHKEHGTGLTTSLMKTELRFMNDLQQWVDTEGQNIKQRSAGQDVEAAWLMRAQGINGLAKKHFAANKGAERAMAQREHVGNAAHENMVGRQSVERGRHCRSFDRGGLCEEMDAA